MKTVRAVSVSARRLCALLAIAVSGCATSGPPPRRPAAVVDLQRAAMECREGRAAREQLTGKFRASQAILDRRGEQLHATMAQIKADRERGQDVSAREQSFRQDLAVVHAEYERLQRELTAEEQRRAAPIYARLRAALPRLAADHHVDKVVESGPGAPGPDVVDLTADLIRMVDGEPR